MRSWWPTAVVVVAAVAAYAPFVHVQVPSRGAGRSATPRTTWGDPDLTGRWPSTNMVGVPLERPTSFGSRNTLTNEEFAARQAQADKQSAIDNSDFDPDMQDQPAGNELQTRVSGVLTIPSPLGPQPHWYELGTPSRQASLLVDPRDGRFPPLTAEGQRRQAAIAALRQKPNSLADRSPYTRCISRGVVGSAIPMFADSGNEIVQAPGYVVIRHEMIHEARVIPLDGRPPLSSAIRQYMGDSRGRWDGDTLVITTTNLNGRVGTGPNGGGTVLSEAARITERLTRMTPDIIQYAVTVDDPNTWTRPWTMAFPWQRESRHVLFEFSCHEGNRALRNILAAELAGS